MLNYLWFFLMAASLIFGAFNGTLPQISDALMDGAGQAVELSIFLLGGMCAWLGFLKIAETSGLTDQLARLLSPVIDKLFPEYRGDGEIKGKISMNISANLLGIGNAATPMGLAAMKAMAEKNPHKDRPTKGMILFVLINTASLQLIPMNMASIRDSCGSAQPFDILPQVWFTSLGALLTCIFLAKALERRDSALGAGNCGHKHRRLNGKSSR